MVAAALLFEANQFFIKIANLSLNDLTTYSTKKWHWPYLISSQVDLRQLK
jgi:hypothetical protein